MIAECCKIRRAPITTIQSSGILDINLKVSSCVCGSVEGRGMGLFHEYKLRLKESGGGSNIT